VWTDAADLQRWIGLPRHVEVMRRYRPRGAARSTKWTCETFDRSAILAEGRRRLANGELATVRDSELVMRPSFWQTLHARRRRAQGDRTLVVAHEDVLVFRKPAALAREVRPYPKRKAA
jgi:hypothetical protein